MTSRDGSLAAAYYVLGLILLVLIFLPIFPFVTKAGLGIPNYSIVTKVNITNAPPQVTNITLLSPITLTANATTHIDCNATVSDLNGAGDISQVNATFFMTNISNDNLPDDNTTHYTNASCTNFTDVSSITRYYSCGFNINYNANPGNWSCNVTANDSKRITDSSYSTTTINTLIALIVPEILDFGQIDVSNITNNVPLNITNVGNRRINISVWAYARSDNDSLAMLCENGNISIGNLRVTTQFNLSNISQNLIQFSDMTPVNNTNFTPTTIGNLTVMQLNGTMNMSINTTVWRLNVPVAGRPNGICNGTLVFRAFQGA